MPQVGVQELQGIQQIETVKASDKLHVVNVQPGSQIGNNWIVASGLQPGTRAVTDNPQESPLATAAGATSTTDSGWSPVGR